MQLEKMEKEIELYREDVRTKSSEMNSNMALWLAVLTIIMAILGVAIPLILNRRNEKMVEKLLEDTKDEANLAKEQAKKSVDAFEKIQSQVDSVKEQVLTATKQAQKAEEAAKESKSNQLFASAVNEDDSFKAETLFTQVIELCPQKAEAYYYRAHLRNNNLDALKDYDKAIELIPNYAEALYDRGNLKIIMNDNASAIMDFDKLISLEPHNSNAYSCRGTAKENIGDVKGAMVDFNKAIELYPNDYYAYLKRGNLKFYLNDLNGALNDLDNSIKIFPNYPETIASRAKCYRKMAEIEQDDKKRQEWISKAEADEKMKAEFDARVKAKKERSEMLNIIQL